MRSELLSWPTLSARRIVRAISLSSVVAFSFLMLHGSLGHAQDPFEDLRSRLEQLERDNRELRSALTNRSDDWIVPTVSEIPPSPDDLPTEGGGESDDDRRIGSLVEGYLRRIAEQSRIDNDAQDRKIAALESKANAKPKPTSASGNYGAGGLVFTSADGNFKTHFGGTAQLDFIAPQSTATGITTPGGAYGYTDTTTFRRLRVRADGTMWGNIDWVSEFDFAMALQNTNSLNAASAAGGTVPGTTGVTGLRSTGTDPAAGNQGGNTINVIQPTTVFVTYKDLDGFLNIRVGNQQDWFSLEHITSARWLDFMERAPIMDAFAGPNNNGYTPGVSFFGNTPDKNMGLQLGVYKSNYYDSGFTYDMGNAFTYGGRAVWTPYYDECSEGAYLVHTAFGAEYRNLNTTLASSQTGQNVRLRSRGDLRINSSTLDPNFADTGNFYATGQVVIDPEIAIVWGPWTVQAEYTQSWFTNAATNQPGTQGGVSKAISNVRMSGGYVETLYFLTGEHKNYNRQTGAFNQTIVKNTANFAQGTYGAWQVGARYDWMDLNSGIISGGQNQAGTLGLNWWLNSNVRFQFNANFMYINNAPSVGGAANPGLGTFGNLNGSKFNGEGLITTLGTRMDISF